MQTARFFISAAAEFTACMQNSKDNLRCRYTGLMHAGRNAASVVMDRYRAVLMQRYIDRCTIFGQMLINCVVDNLPNEMVKS
ncbi:hypothetical protein D3C79_896120 [compost metagenome]